MTPSLQSGSALRCLHHCLPANPRTPAPLCAPIQLLTLPLAPACVDAVLSSWVESLKGVASDPLSVAFPTIQNDQSGARSWGPGVTEVNARTIKPKEKDFDPKKRVVGIPGLNVFGAPSSKQEGDIFKIFD